VRFAEAPPGFCRCGKRAGGALFCGGLPRSAPSPRFSGCLAGSLWRAAAVVEDRLEIIVRQLLLGSPAGCGTAGANEPVAATPLWRNFTHDRARSSRYGHVARHLRGSAWLAQQVRSWRRHLPHADYVATLRQRPAARPAFVAGSTAIARRDQTAPAGSVAFIRTYTSL